MYLLQLPEHHQPIEPIPVCRLCGIQSLEVSYLDSYSESGRFILLAVQKYLEIEVGEKNVCHTCSQKVEDWNSFYLKCHEVQSIFKQSCTSLALEVEGVVSSDDPAKLDQQTCTVLVQDSVANHLSKLVEELVQDASAAADETTKDLIIPPVAQQAETNLIMQEEATRLIEDPSQQMDEDQCQTEDEYEDELSSDDDDEDESQSEGSDEAKPRKKPRHKKFIFSIPFLERKLDRKFTPAEKTKLQKYISKRQNTLIYEMLVGGGPGHLWECQICQKTIKGRVGEVARHYLQAHQVEPVLPCHVCDHTSRTEKMYQAHRMSHLVEYPCEHCGRLFHQHSRLVYHLTSHTNEREYACDVCGKKFNTAQYLTTHKRKVHGDQEKLLKYTCELCGMRFKYKNHLQYHQKRHPTDENPLPYSCKYCEEHFMTRAEQLAHSNTVHAGEGDFVCHLCGKKMKTILSLENHVKLHSGLKEFKCEQCGAAFATNHSLKCHRKIHERDKEDSQQYVCDVCHKPMSNKSSLNQHLKTHLGTRPHQCPHCSAAFIHKNRLEIHMRKHTGDCPIRCVDCGKGFRSTSSMNSHRQYVHSERKFACQVCGKAFKTPRDLKVHATLHTGEKPNVCGVCGKAFRVRANYFKHRKIHTRAAAKDATSMGALPEEPEEEEEVVQQQQQPSTSVVPPPPVAVPAGDPSATTTTGDFAFHFAPDHQQWIA